MLRTTIILTVLLSLLFWRAFDSHTVVFSNDNPLGGYESAKDRDPSLVAIWSDLNWVGFKTNGIPFPSLDGLAMWLWFKLGGSAMAISKFFTPLSLLTLGLSFHLLGLALSLRPWACTWLALAASLNGWFFSIATWGLQTWVMATAMCVTALATLLCNWPSKWKVPLIGFLLGVCLVDGADVGVILMAFTLCFSIAYWLLHGERGKTIWLVLAVVLVAGVVAYPTIQTHIDVNVRGIKGLR